MPEIKILYSWDNPGKDNVDLYISDAVPEGELRVISAADLKYILNMRNNDRRWAQESVGESLINCDEVLDDKKYFVYYNYHSAGGYKTEITIDESRNIKVFVHPPEGLSLRSFWSEVIVFEIV